MQVLKGHRYDKPVRSLAFAPDGERLASSARDYKTFLWDLATGKYEVVEEDDSYTVAFSPDGRTVATGQQSGVCLWDARTKQTRRFNRWYDQGHGIEVVFTRDSLRLITVSRTIRVFDVATLADLNAIPGEQCGHATNSVALTPDGRVLATGHDRPRHCVRLWDVASWSRQGELKGPTGAVSALAFSPDGRFLAAAAGATLWVWDVPAGEAVVRHTIDKQFYKDVAFSPDGRFLAFARNDATVRLWETAGWAEVAAFDWKVGPMITVAFAPDGMRAAAGSGKGKIVVWDVDL